MSRKLPNLREAWESYRAKVVPAGADDIQVECSEMSFVAGFFAAYLATVTTMNATMLGFLSEEQSADYLQGLRKEIDAYMNGKRSPNRN